MLDNKLKNKYLPLTAVYLLFSAAQIIAAPAEMDPASADILNQYLATSAAKTDAHRQGSLDLEISASVPRLKKQGRLHVLRDISKVGKVTYRVLGFQGDNAIKNQVIARYLQAEQQTQGDPGLALVPINYKFKFKGERETNAGSNVYVFQVSPRRKRIGLFKGELWLDAESHLPVFEKGRLVKNPSIFFKKVAFERAYTIRDGSPLPDRMRSIIETRVVGRVELNVNYSEADTPGSERAETSSLSPSCN